MKPALVNQMKDDFSVVVASTPYKKKLVAEIFYENVQWAEINQELSDEMIIQFYPHPKKDYWEFSLDDALAALEHAKQRFLKLGSTKRTAWTLESSDRAYDRGDTSWKITEIVDCKAKPNYILWVRFDDGLEGEVDLSDKVGQGVFKAWESEEFWLSARVDTAYGTVNWGKNGEIDLDPYVLKEKILGINESNETTEK